jgi:uncharacterized protein YbjT (DUF2867 family)
MTTVCVVFGGTGFLGRRLVQRLAAEGATLRVAARSPDRARSVLPAAVLENVTLFRADVHDRASVVAAIAGADAGRLRRRRALPASRHPAEADRGHRADLYRPARQGH